MRLRRGRLRRSNRRVPRNRVASSRWTLTKHSGSRPRHSRIWHPERMDPTGEVLHEPDLGHQRQLVAGRLDDPFDHPQRR